MIAIVLLLALGTRNDRILIITLRSIFSPISIRNRVHAHCITTDKGFTMKSINTTFFIEHYCKVTTQWCVMVGYPYPEFADDCFYAWTYSDYAYEVAKALPKGMDVASFLSTDDRNYLFPSLEAAMNFYDQIIGDGGPTKLNDYSGPITIYALLIGPEGILTENT